MNKDIQHIEPRSIDEWAERVWEEERNNMKKTTKKATASKAMVKKGRC